MAKSRPLPTKTGSPSPPSPGGNSLRHTRVARLSRVFSPTGGAPPLRSWQGWEASSTSTREKYKSESKTEEQGLLVWERAVDAPPTLGKGREGWDTPDQAAPATTQPL